MNAARAGWVRVTRSRPCPVCGKPDWCLLTPDGSAAICARTESDRRAGDAGYLHKLRADDWQSGRGRRVTVPTVRAAEPAPDFGALAERCAAAVTGDKLDLFACELGVLVDALRRLGAGWDGEAWCFPMRGADGRVCGIRRRFPDGRKLSMRGGREGLFVPTGLPRDGLVLITEGPTDCAALLTLGFAAVGRPSCRGAVRLVCDLARGRDVVIVADGDEPGRLGAEALANLVALYCPCVRIIRPPAGMKDARQWVQRGATAADVRRTIDAAEPVRIGIRTRTAAR